MIQRNSHRKYPSFCRNCHIPLTQCVREVHEGYCHIKTSKCIKCANKTSQCIRCNEQIPACQQKAHQPRCESINTLRNKLKILETSCPYCYKSTNINDISKHLDICQMRKDRKVLSENTDRNGKIIKSNQRQDETSVERINKNRDVLSYKLYKKVIGDQIRFKNNFRSPPQKPYTQKVIKLEQVQEKQKNQKISLEWKFFTPLPLFLKTKGNFVSHFSEIKPVGVERHNVGKLAKNY